MRGDLRPTVGAKQAGKSRKVAAGKRMPAAKRRRSRAHPSSWQQRFDALAAFKRQHGHCNVPGKHPPDQPLANWVCNLRSLKKAGRLDEVTVRRLDGMGFCWSIKNRRLGWLDWDEMLAGASGAVDRPRPPKTPLLARKGRPGAGLLPSPAIRPAAVRASAAVLAGHRGSRGDCRHSGAPADNPIRFSVEGDSWELMATLARG